MREKGYQGTEQDLGYLLKRAFRAHPAVRKAKRGKKGVAGRASPPPRRVAPLGDITAPPGDITTPLGDVAQTCECVRWPRGGQEPRCDTQE